MAFQNLQLKRSYQSGTDHIIDDFYTKCLNDSVLYQRAVAYFTSASLSTAAHGIANLISNNGSMQFVVSPHLLEDDIRYIQKGKISIKDAILKNSIDDFKNIKSKLIEERLEALAWMVATKKIAFKIALTVDHNNVLTKGLYHEKIGIFTDADNNKIAFQGSGNESAGAFNTNWESHRVFWSWDEYRKHDQQDISEQFKSLWGNKVPKLEVTDFGDVAEEVLKKYKRSRPPTVKKPNSEEPCIPIEITPHEHQRLAVNNWFRNNGRGLLKMATGSGKTITALIACTKLYLKGKIKAVIVLCPYQHLVDQWNENARFFNYNPILAYEIKKNWYEDLSNALLDESNLLFLITSNDTFSGESFQMKLEYFPLNETLIIADEVHNIGTENNIKALPQNAKFRLGLSATPERWFDEEGTGLINDYFGEILKPEFTLNDAIKSGTLCKYKYFPIKVELTEDESLKYFEITKKIVRLSFNAKEKNKEEKDLSGLYIERASILACAFNKLNELEVLMRERSHTHNWIFYCGDRSVSDPTSESEEKQIDAVTKILGRNIGMRVDSFIAETSRENRQSIISKLTKKELQGLVAIRCLDEGVDIPTVDKIVILASSTNPKQFIQRRGRVLRKNKEDPDKIAEIYDMIAIPAQDNDSSISDTERNLVRKELKRFDEFAELAINSGQARGAIFDLKKKYKLLDL